MRTLDEVYEQMARKENHLKNLSEQSRKIQEEMRTVAEGIRELESEAREVNDAHYMKVKESLDG